MTRSLIAVAFALAAGSGGAGAQPAGPYPAGPIRLVVEAGLPGFEFDAGWHGWFAPAKTPPAILNRIHAEIVKALQVPSVREFYLKNGYEPLAQPPVEFRKVFIADIARYAEIVRAAKIDKQ